MQGHARGTHVENRRDKVDRPQDRAGPRQVKGENRKIHSGEIMPGKQSLPGAGKRRIHCPAGSGAATNQCRQQQQRKCRNQQPERDVVHTREGHIRRADHQWHEPVPKAPDQSGHNNKEHHDQTMRGDHRIPFMPARHNLNARFLQFHPHIDGSRTPDQSCNNREDKIHRPDVFMVG